MTAKLPPDWNPDEFVKMLDAQTSAVLFALCRVQIRTGKDWITFPEIYEEYEETVGKFKLDDKSAEILGHSTYQAKPKYFVRSKYVRGGVVFHEFAREKEIDGELHFSSIRDPVSLKKAIEDFNQLP